MSVAWTTRSAMNRIRNCRRLSPVLEATVPEGAVVLFVPGARRTPVPPVLPRVDKFSTGAPALTRRTYLPVQVREWTRCHSRSRRVRLRVVAGARDGGRNAPGALTELRGDYDRLECCQLHLRCHRPCPWELCSTDSTVPHTPALESLHVLSGAMEVTDREAVTGV